MLLFPIPGLTEKGRSSFIKVKPLPSAINKSNQNADLFRSTDALFRQLQTTSQNIVPPYNIPATDIQLCMRTRLTEITV